MAVIKKTKNMQAPHNTTIGYQSYPTAAHVPGKTNKVYLTTVRFYCFMLPPVTLVSILEKAQARN